MSATLLRIATLATIGWTRIYTAGLADDIGRARREQVASDLWEQAHDATDARAVAFSILGRLARGLPDDVTWRLFGTPPRLAVAALDLEGGIAVKTQSRLPLLLMVTAAGWLLTLAFAVEAPAHSLLVVGGFLTLVSLTCWLMDARESGDEAPPIAWPLLAAIGLGAAAMGVVFDSGRLGLIVSLPVSIAFTAMAIQEVAVGRTAGAGRTLPVSPEVIQRKAIAGDVIAIERVPERRVSRRRLLQGSAWLGIGAVVAAAGGVVVDFLWQRNVAGFGGIVVAGNTGDFPPGSKTKITAGKFWLVHLTAEQGGPGFLALWQKCPHLGCTVPWEPGFAFKDGETGQTTRGWFRCPCHQSTYNDAGVRVFGPAPRSMDRMAVTIGPDGEIEVDTAAIEKGNVDNASHAVSAPEL